MSYHPLTDGGGNYGVTVIDETLTDSSTENLDLTTLSDGSTASGIPSTNVAVFLKFKTDDGAALTYIFSDNTYAPLAATNPGPNCVGEEANVDYFVKVITKSDGSVDLKIGSGVSSPNVEVVVLGYEDVDSYNNEFFNEYETFICGSRAVSGRYSSTTIEDSGSNPCGAGWHKLYVEFFGGTVNGCAVAGGTNDYDLEDQRIVVGDLDTAVVDGVDINRTVERDTRGAGCLLVTNDSTIKNCMSACTDSSSNVEFYWRANYTSTFNPV